MLGPVGDSFLKNSWWRLTIYCISLFTPSGQRLKSCYTPEANNYGLEAKDYTKSIIHCKNTVIEGQNTKEAC